MKTPPAKKITAESQKTFWNEVLRFAVFTGWEWVAKLAHGKIVCNIYVDGVLKEQVKFEMK
jgi:hypothetical protein